MNTIGSRIAENRRRIGMTQEELAAKLAVSAQAVSKWENDITCPDVMTLPKLAELLGITDPSLAEIISQGIQDYLDASGAASLEELRGQALPGRN